METNTKQMTVLRIWYHSYPSQCYKFHNPPDLNLGRGREKRKIIPWCKKNTVQKENSIDARENTKNSAKSIDYSEMAYILAKILWNGASLDSIFAGCRSLQNPNGWFLIFVIVLASDQLFFWHTVLWQLIWGIGLKK